MCIRQLSGKLTVPVIREVLSDIPENFEDHSHHLQNVLSPGKFAPGVWSDAV